MGREMNDTELDKLLEEEMIREAEMIEHSLLCDDQTEDVHVSEEEIERSYARLMKRLKAEGLCQEKKQEQKAEVPGEKKAVIQTANPVLEQLTDCCYGIWYPSEEKLEGEIKFLIKNGTTNKKRLQN